MTINNYHVMNEIVIDRGPSSYAIQLEIAQSCYMNESSLTYDIALAKKLTITLKKMLETFMMTAEKYNKSLD